MRLLSYILLRLIDAYAVTIGPHFGGRCRFEPSCSCYAHEAITRYGPFRGIYLSVVRLVKCGPWHSGGYDPVPKQHNH
ncbi:membrane protein insertion efficiency factor YidD [candidate division KSB1 bacterium]|nr:MAG: membrane protein insertion efficiency factor YidD [candidate division KSB1 bacterium]